MNNTTVPSPASEQYAAAYHMHYTGGDLGLALDLYRTLMAAYPNEREAEFACMQIQNIIKSTVPKQQLLDAQVELAIAHLGQERRIEPAVLISEANQSKLT